MEQPWITPQSNDMCRDNQPLVEEEGVSSNAPDALLGKGIAAAKAGDHLLAQELLTQVTKHDPANEAALMWLASISKQPQERMSLIEKILKINPNNQRAIDWEKVTRAQCINSLLHRGIEAAKIKDNALAMHLLLQTTDQDPDNEIAWLWLASVAESIEDQLAYLQRALTINPNNQRTKELYTSAKKNLARRLLQKGIAEAASGNRKLASEILEDVLEYDSTLEDAWFLKACVTDSLEEKIAYFEKCLAINPMHHQAQAGLQAAQQKLAASRISFKCPFCSAKAEKELEECTECCAHLTLEDIDGLLNNNRINESLLKAAVERLENQNGMSKKDYYLLGLAHLNLKNLKQGIKFLQDSFEMDSANETLNARIGCLLERQAEVERTAQLKEQQERKARKAIMVVDDSPTVCKLVKMKLEKHGYRVITAVDGIDALEKLEEETPDLMLLDINMPRLDGYQLCKRVKGDPATKHIPVVMLSGKDGFFDKLRGRMAGSAAYLTKPFEPDELLDTVGKYCEK